MNTKCRFVVNEVKQNLGTKPSGNKDERNNEIWEPAMMFTVSASPVYGNGDPEHPNTKFWAASPNGRFELGTVNEDAVKDWKPGTILEFDIRVVEPEKS
jgi:hypothetical protein